MGSSFNHHGGCSTKEALNFPQVHLPWSRPREARRHAYARAHRACARRRFKHGLPRKYWSLLKRLRNAKKACNTADGEKPVCIKTHLRNMIILPEMIGSVVGVYNGKTFNQVEVKADMVGHYLAEFSMSYKPVKHGTAGIGATKSSRFVPLK